MTVFALVWWSVWLAMLIVGDPLLIWIGGEKLSDTHFLVTHIAPALRAGIIGWLAYHFLVQHLRS